MCYGSKESSRSQVPRVATKDWTKEGDRCSVSEVSPANSRGIEGKCAESTFTDGNMEVSLKPRSPSTARMDPVELGWSRHESRKALVPKVFDETPIETPFKLHKKSCK